jgi:hypothetical protein
VGKIEEIKKINKKWTLVPLRRPAVNNKHNGGKQKAMGMKRRIERKKERPN